MSLKHANHISRYQTFPFVKRPGRYQNHEWPLYQVPDAAFNAVIAFPDTYEIGMSNYGLQILYYQLRKKSNIQVDTVFSPWPDYENYLRNQNIPLTSLNQKQPLNQFDVIFISIPHELSYTNILNLLDLGHIPLHSHTRKESDPMVIGGGMCTLNPLPLSDFFDAFLIGDGEYSILEITDAFMDTQGLSRYRRLESLKRIDGVYIPLIHTAPKDRSINKCTIDDLDKAPYPSPPMIPFCQPVQERVVIEIARGCPRQCRFCQAQKYYGSVRNRSMESIIEIAQTNLKQTGYDEISLLSLNVMDYPGIENLLNKIAKPLFNQNISVSLPSLRPEKLTTEIVEMVSQVRKSGFTLAPEAGSETLRKIIGKPYSTDKLLTSTLSIFKAGWKLIKLYFMIGQPFEKDSDIDAIIALVKNIHNIGRKVHGRKVELHVSCAIFIPKPHTPFQWCGQDSTINIQRKINHLKRKLRLPGVKFSYHNLFASRLETLLAKGNKTMGSILSEAHESGCQFESWHEWFKVENWQNIFQSNNIDIESETTRWSQIDEKLCWNFIDPGVSYDNLISNFKDAQELSLRSSDSDKTNDFSVKLIQTGSLNPNGRQPKTSDGQLDTYRYWCIYRCIGDYRFFSHHERIAALLRAMRRAHLPILYSQGFNPRPKISTTTPPPLGMEIIFDVIELRLSEKLNHQKIRELINQELPEEMWFYRIIDPTEKSLTKRIQSGTYLFEVDDDTIEKVKECDQSGYLFLSISDILRNYSLVSDFDEMPYNLAFIHNMKELNHITLKDIINFLFGSKIFPFNTFRGARLSWNLDTSGHHPFT